MREPEIDSKNHEPTGALPLQEVERVVDLLKESGVGEIRIRQGDVEVTVKAKPEVAAPSVPQNVLAGQPATPEPSVELSPDGLHTIRSPLVGTFYPAPAPGEQPYVEVGDTVVAGQTLCIVEAMKLMNEIPADISGEVVEILAESAGGVEYDQPLFHLRPEG